MLKMLIAVAVAMLACCCAAAWAGHSAPIIAPASVEATYPDAFDVMPPDGVNIEHLKLGPAEYTAFHPMLGEDDAGLELPPPAQAVIPLPVPLYAAAALAPLAWWAHRALRRR